MAITAEGVAPAATRAALHLAVFIDGHVAVVVDAVPAELGVERAAVGIAIIAIEGLAVPEGAIAVAVDTFLDALPAITEGEVWAAAPDLDRLTLVCEDALDAVALGPAIPEA